MVFFVQWKKWGRYLPEKLAESVYFIKWEKFRQPNH